MAMRLVHPDPASKLPSFLAVAASILPLLLLVPDCSDRPGPSVESDTTPPAAIGDLGVTDSSCATITVSWTAPAEDGEGGGTVSSYDIRYGIGTIESVPWDSMMQVSDEPSPQPPGTRQSYVVRDLQEGTLYSIAIRSADDWALLSPISNVASGWTATGDCIPPGPISDLAVVDTTATSAVLTWTAPAEDGFAGGRAAFYDLRYTIGILGSESWSLADTASGEPTPGYPGTDERFGVTGLDPGATYQFGVRSVDDAGNESVISNILTVRIPAHPDTIPPDPVDDLAVAYIDPYRLTLTWTATGDDGRTGRASAYDLRMRIADHFDETDWASAEQLVGEPAPGDPGSIETFDVGGLAPGATFALALRVTDGEGNVSAMSNVAVATAPPPSIPLFVDPRGICSDPLTGEVMVAEHVESGGTLYRFNPLGEKRAVALLPHATGVRTASRGGWFAIGGEAGVADGIIWRYDGLQSLPRIFREGLHSPTALAVRADTVIVIEEGIGGVVLYGDMGVRRALVNVTDGVPAGIAIDADGFVYFGVNRYMGTPVIRRCTTSNGQTTDIHDIGPGGEIGDLLLDESGTNLWYLDTMRGAIIGFGIGGGLADTIATGLIHPVAMTSLVDPRFVSYSSSDGFVLRALRRR